MKVCVKYRGAVWVCPIEEQHSECIEASNLIIVNSLLQGPLAFVVGVVDVSPCIEEEPGHLPALAVKYGPYEARVSKEIRGVHLCSSFQKGGPCQQGQDREVSCRSVPRGACGCTRYSWP